MVTQGCLNLIRHESFKRCLHSGNPQIIQGGSREYHNSFSGFSQRNRHPFIFFVFYVLMEVYLFLRFGDYLRTRIQHEAKGNPES